MKRKITSEELDKKVKKLLSSSLDEAWSAKITKDFLLRK